MKHFTNPPRADGFGSQFLTIICSILYHKDQFVYTPIKSIEHNYDNDPYFIDKCENCMNIKNHFPINDGTANMLSIPELYNNVIFNIDKYSNDLIRLKNIFRENKKNPFEDKSICNVAIHIRKQNKGDQQICIDRHNYRNDWEGDLYLNIMNQLRRKYDNIHFNIYSQKGLNIERYTNHDVSFHIDEDLFTTFTSMVYADILMTSRSTLSYAAALLSESSEIYFMKCMKKQGLVPMSDWIVFG